MLQAKKEGNSGHYPGSSKTRLPVQDTNGGNADFADGENTSKFFVFMKSGLDRCC